MVNILCFKSLAFRHAVKIVNLQFDLCKKSNKHILNLGSIQYCFNFLFREFIFYQTLFPNLTTDLIFRMTISMRCDLSSNFLFNCPFDNFFMFNVLSFRQSFWLVILCNEPVQSTVHYLLLCIGTDMYLAQSIDWGWLLHILKDSAQVQTNLFDLGAQTVKNKNLTLGIIMDIFSQNLRAQSKI